MTDAPVTEIRLRLATPADVDALARLHVQAFNETHGPGPSLAMRRQQWRDAFVAGERQWFCLVAETSDGRLVGFARGQPYADEGQSEYQGELNKIYVLRGYQGRGLGRRLVCAAGRELMGRGIDSMVLFGDARSPSNGFYERMGAARLFAPNGEFHGGYGWQALTELLRHCEELPQGWVGGQGGSGPGPRRYEERDAMADGLQSKACARDDPHGPSRAAHG